MTADSANVLTVRDVAVHTEVVLLPPPLAVKSVPPVLLCRGVRGSLQQCFLSGCGEKLWPPDGHRRRGLQGQHLGCEQGQLHHGEASVSWTTIHISTPHWSNIFIKEEVITFNCQCFAPVYPDCVCFSQSLTGHNNPVECVHFSVSEEQVVAGSQSGSIRVWDLEAAKSEYACLCNWRPLEAGSSKFCSQLKSFSFSLLSLLLSCFYRSHYGLCSTVAVLQDRETETLSL